LVLLKGIATNTYYFVPISIVITNYLPATLPKVVLVTQNKLKKIIFDVPYFLFLCRTRELKARVFSVELVGSYRGVKGSARGKERYPIVREVEAAWVRDDDDR
jgi:hypothetical protein